MDSRLPVRLTLVSASPRRRELLAKLGIPFDVFPTDVEEVLEGEDGKALAMLNARLKVERSSWFNDRSRVLLGADTLISLDHRMFGKPGDAEDARRMLSELSGRAHDVITGVCLSGPSLSSDSPFIHVQSAVISQVRFKPLSPENIQKYLDSGEWDGKAGAYAIQGLGSALIADLTGDFDNVVGLPTDLIHDLLRTHYSHCRFL